ncbi:bifunctional serine/threonine-protein kinase/formylglycine-generating enzyme family protein [Lentisphaera profundi]|uniref:Bifunctional serine/threonine-protein kinase/formylglycine-generating enzyme family protein n=1 Tax=Lentisphaera profundi TaxID=1658616 RepID=A0ABY7VRI5_9BACT|nr:bifunctional serine/threonine-protein kinase/formylglycine-generating enzyme family protein [Lentisphaera profundi]WDE96647.1 bifunctional serine/threonine-protein kinase/formylglycine-generating enzyme family protein [Lentisphaera profundi]
MSGDDIDVSVGDMPTMKGNDPPVSIDVSLDDMATMPGDNQEKLAIVDRYELLEMLGRGAFGAVFLARDTVSDQLVALKTLPPELSHSAEDLEAVRENFKLVSDLSHPNIAQLKFLHQVAEVNSLQGGVHIVRGEYLVVMEYIEGSTLSSWKKQFSDRKVPIEKALDICTQVAAALDYAHGKQIIHRDIKPGNIMIEADGQVQVLDFGLAAEVRSSMSRLSTETGSTSGTRPYMPPEQLLGQGQNHSADQYALAVMFYELISGTVPFLPVFESGDMQLILAVVPSQAAVPLDGLSKKENRVLLKALSKNKSDRYPSCMEFMEAFAGGKIKKVRSPQKKKGKIPMMVAFVVLLTLFFAWWGVDVKQNKPIEITNENSGINEDLIRSNDQQERAVEVKDEKQDKLRELLRLAQSAYDANQWVEANGFAQKVLALDPQNNQAKQIQQKVADQMGMNQVVPVKSRAEVLYEQVINSREIDSSDGFASRLMELRSKSKMAKTYLEVKNYAKAVSAYQDLEFSVKDYIKSDLERDALKLKIAKMSQLNTGLSNFGVVEFDEAKAAVKIAERSLPKGDFAISTKLYQAAEQKIISANQVAKKAYEKDEAQRKLVAEATRVQSQVPQLLSQHQTWLGYDESKEAYAKARQAYSSKNYVEAIKLYGLYANKFKAMKSDLSPQVQKYLSRGMKVVKNATYSSLNGLAAGSAEMQLRQKEWVAKGWPLELELAKTGLRFRLVPPGDFMMGSPRKEEGRDADEAQKQVTISKPYYLMKTEITQAQWTKIMGKNPSYFKNAGSNAPVESISWEDCQNFIRRLSSYEGAINISLPSKAQWEYACRAATKSSIYNGNMKIHGERNAPLLDEIAWYGGNSGVTYAGAYDSSYWKEKQYDHSRAGTHPVALKMANALGMYDMQGNVWEWCADWYNSDRQNRVYRGGSWNDDAQDCRSANGYGYSPGQKTYDLGARLALSH